MYSKVKRQKKEEIQARFYDVNFRSNCLILAGPRPRHAFKLASKVAKDYSIFSYERNKETYLKQKAFVRLKNLNTNKYILVNDEVINASVHRFIDLDLMCTIKYGYKTIAHLLDEQRKIKLPKKCFIGTLSLRKRSKLDTLTVLEGILLCILGFNGITYTFEYDTYNDMQGPMLTFRVLYN